MQLFNTGIDYLKIDIASNFGLDKKTWNERVEWYDANEGNLYNLVERAETPALFYAGIKAIEKAKAGQASGYPISLDATSSGLQILACLTGDRKAAELCNVLNFSEEGVNQRRDGYTVIYNAMVNRIGEEGKIKRDDVKRAIMTALYGSEAVPKEVFGEGLLLSIFEDTMATMAPAAWGLNKAYLTMWNPEAWCNSWVLPDNFHVHVKVMAPEVETVHFLNEPIDIQRYVNKPVEEGRSLGANTTHSIDGMIVREMVRRCDYDADRVRMIRTMVSEIEAGYAPSVIADDKAELVETLWKHFKACGYLSARILDVLDYTNIMMVDLEPIKELLASLPAKPFKVIAIHDCFRCLPNYGNDLRKQYNNQLMLLARSELLSYMLTQLLGRHIEVGKEDPEMWREIAEADYALS